MGMYAGMYGEPHVPQEKRAELAQRLLKLMQQGGMMRVLEVPLLLQPLHLLAPIELEKDGTLCVGYNYFEDDTWEDTCYNTATGRLNGGKVGSSIFGMVVQAGYILCEQYSDTPCIARWCGVVQQSEKYPGWLNYLFGEQYTNRRAVFGRLLVDEAERQKYSADFCRAVQAIHRNKSEADLEQPVRRYAEMLVQSHATDFVPAPAVSTEGFLASDTLNDDDRAFFWTPQGEVTFSAEMQAWLKALAAQMDEIQQNNQLPMDPDACMQDLVSTLLYIEKTFYRLYSFVSMGNDMAEHADDPRVQAATLLLKSEAYRLAKELPDEVECEKNSWMPKDPRMYSPARRQLKRLLAVMGNSALRKDAFGF